MFCVCECDALAPCSPSLIIRLTTILINIPTSSLVGTDNWFLKVVWWGERPKSRRRKIRALSVPDFRLCLKLQPWRKRGTAQSRASKSGEQNRRARGRWACAAQLRCGRRFRSFVILVFSVRIGSGKLGWGKIEAIPILLHFQRIIKYFEMFKAFKNYMHLFREGKDGWIGR